METITTYLDNVFAAYEQTEDLLRLKSEMLCNMKEKYAALKEEGISENEAVGRVISDFGSIDEISFELKIKENSAHDEKSQNHKNHKNVSKEEADKFFAEKIKFSKGIGFAIWLVLFGASMVVLSNELSEYTDFITQDAASGIGATFMLLFIAAALPIFIIFGIRSKKYENWGKEIILTDPAVRAEYSRAYEAYTTNFALKIAAGIGFIILPFIGIILTDSFGFNLLNEAVMPSILIFSVGAALYLFIIAGVKREAFEILLGKDNYEEYDKGNYGEYGKSNYDGYDKKYYVGYCENGIKSADDNDKLIAVIASIYWPCIVAVFLLWSFLTNDWGITWIVFPIAGVIFGGIAGPISIINSKKNRR
ncbi:MAG: permease prefix domain 1-containing protein [Ruminococcus sp.]|jgi:hypothetical protein|nr:permease prefix domain 1-containing protein [Ruminococcus sp.]